MRIITASQGFTTDEIENEVAKIVGKPASEINIAIINESAYALDKSKSKRWLIKELSNIEKHIGGRIEFIDDYDEIVRISRELCYKFTDDEEYISKEIADFAKSTLLFRLVPEYMTGKRVNES